MYNYIGSCRSCARSVENKPVGAIVSLSMVIDVQTESDNPFLSEGLTLLDILGQSSWMFSQSSVLHISTPLATDGFCNAKAPDFATSQQQVCFYFTPCVYMYQSQRLSVVSLLLTD